MFDEKMENIARSVKSMTATTWKLVSHHRRVAAANANFGLLGRRNIQDFSLGYFAIDFITSTDQSFAKCIINPETVSTSTSPNESPNRRSTSATGRTS